MSRRLLDPHRRSTRIGLCVLSVTAVAGLLLACASLDGLSGGTSDAGRDGGHDDVAAPRNDARADSKVDARIGDAGVHETAVKVDTGVADAAVEVRHPLFFSWVTPIDAGIPDGAVAPPPDSGVTSYVQPFVIYPLEDGGVAHAIGCAIPVQAEIVLPVTVPPDAVPENMSALGASSTGAKSLRSGALVYVIGPAPATFSNLVLATPGTTCGTEVQLTSSFARQFVFRPSVAPAGDRVAYFQTLVGAPGSYTGIVLRVLSLADGGPGATDTVYHSYAVGTETSPDSGGPPVAVGWDPTVGDFGWVAVTDAGPTIFEGADATPFCTTPTSLGLGVPSAYELGFGEAHAFKFALVMSGDYGGIKITWVERGVCDTQPFPAAGNFGDFALSPDGTHALVVGPPAGADGGPAEVDGGISTALWLATTTPSAGGAFSLELCHVPGTGLAVASPVWLDPTHIAWNQGQSVAGGWPDDTDLDLNILNNDPPIDGGAVTLMLAEVSDGGCSPAHGTRVPTSTPSGQPLISSPSALGTAFFLDFVSKTNLCAVSAPGRDAHHAPAAPFAGLLLVSLLLRRRRTRQS